MIQFLFEQNIIIYAFAGLCGLGLLVRLIVNQVFKNLVKASENPAEAKNKLVKLIKMRFEACYKAKIGVNNVDTFVDKNVLKYRFCGILLSTWDNFGGQILFLNLLTVPVSVVFGVTFRCGQDKILLTGSVGILSSAILILVDKSINLSAKRRMLHLNLLDYLDNFCKIRLEQETFYPELYEQMRREYAQVAEAKKQVGTSAERAESRRRERSTSGRQSKRRKRRRNFRLRGKKRSAGDWRRPAERKRGEGRRSAGRQPPSEGKRN